MCHIPFLFLPFEEVVLQVEEEERQAYILR